MLMKNSNNIIGKRTRYLPVCSAVRQRTAPPRAPSNIGVRYYSVTNVSKAPASCIHICYKCFYSRCIWGTVNIEHFILRVSIIVTTNLNICPSVFLQRIHGQLNTVYCKTTFQFPPPPPLCLFTANWTSCFYFHFKNSLPALSHSLPLISLLRPDRTFYTHYFECLSFHGHLSFNEATASCLQFPSPLLSLY